VTPHKPPIAEERLYELRQEPESLPENGAVADSLEQVIHEQIEPLAVKPRKRPQHPLRIPPDPALVHPHLHEALKKGRRLWTRALSVIGQNLIRGV
jgi:hypothetical protein